MSYTNIRATIKWWEPHTKKLKYCSSETFDENNNKFGIGWSPGSELMTGKNISTLPTSKIDLSDHLFIKYDIFEVTVDFSPINTPIGIVSKYSENHGIYLRLVGNVL